MTRTILGGMSGANPLGFLGALGLLRLIRLRTATARLGFLADGSYHPFIEGFDGDLAAAIAEDAIHGQGRQAWNLEYEKTEKRGVKVVADLKAPPDTFARFLSDCIDSWLSETDEPVAYAAAFGTSVAVDNKGNTKPTAFHFTAANQQFLGTIESIRASVSRDWAAESLFKGHAARPGSNVRWDPGAERNWALMAADPNDDGTSVDGPMEWLAFRGLPLFPCSPRGGRIVTTAVSGRGDDMELTWPLWCLPASLGTVRSALQMGWDESPLSRSNRGVFAVCTSKIRRTSQGFGNFGPATVST